MEILRRLCILCGKAPAPHGTDVNPFCGDCLKFGDQDELGTPCTGSDVKELSVRLRARAQPGRPSQNVVSELLSFRMHWAILA